MLVRLVDREDDDYDLIDGLVYAVPFDTLCHITLTGHHDFRPLLGFLSSLKCLILRLVYIYLQ